MSVSSPLAGEPARKRVLLSGSEAFVGLQQQVCHRCGKSWWPHSPTKPQRCPGCKSPYWDRPRRLKHTVARLQESVNQEALAKTLRHAVAKALGRSNGSRKDLEDRSLAKALCVLKEMKAAGRTWQEMAERVEREFGAKLDKDRLKALVR